MKDKSIAIIIYTNPDYTYPPVNAIRILEKEYKVIIFSRNVGERLETFSKNSQYYRFGKPFSFKESEQKSLLSKLTEFTSFILKTIYFSRRHNCVVLIAYDFFALTAAIAPKILNPKIKILYHDNQIIKPNAFKWNNLSFWVQKIGIITLKYCIWVSQPDVKRADLFSKFTGIKDVKVVRNFALRDSSLYADKHFMCESIKKNGYVIGVYTGTIGKENYDYIKKLVEFIKDSEFKIAIFMTGVITEEYIKNFLKDRKHVADTSRIFHLGFLSKSEIYSLLKSADFSLELHRPTFSARMNAGSSVKAGEYMAFGLPLIYPSFWNYEPYYKEIGLSYGDDRELIESIKEMVGNENLRKELSENSRLLFREKLYFENEFRQVKERIDQCMNGVN